MKMRAPAIGSAAVIVALLATGCSGEKPAEMRSLKITGTAQLPDGVEPTGELHVEAYHAWTGTGELRHPLLFIGSFTAPVGGFSGAIEYEAGMGEGLVVYAWNDTDGDGVLCTPQNGMELSGLAEVAEFPADEITVELDLNDNCKAPNWFFPPAR